MMEDKLQEREHVEEKTFQRSFYNNIDIDAKVFNPADKSHNMRQIFNGKFQIKLNKNQEVHN